MSGYSNNTIFWVETSKIHPNQYQPRREFEPNALEDLADSIRQYGVLQPLVVTRDESYRDDGSMDVSYELIAGERRLRASKIAELPQVPVIIRKETDSKARLELAIIENLQREDLNPIDRALAFEQLYSEFKLTHAEIGKKMGKSRVYVSNSLRLLSLPDNIKQALMDKKISEGHTRPLLMLNDRPEEQATLLKEILIKNMSVRDAEKIARKVAQDKVRKKEYEVDPKIRDYEKRISENLGTRVHIEPKEKGGKIVIDYFTINDLETIISSFKASNQSGSKSPHRMMEQFLKEAAMTEQHQQQDNLDTSTPLEFKNIKEDIRENQHQSVDEGQVIDPISSAVDDPVAPQNQARENNSIYSEPNDAELKERTHTIQDYQHPNDIQNQKKHEAREDDTNVVDDQTRSFQQHYVEEPLTPWKPSENNDRPQWENERRQENSQQLPEDGNTNQTYHVSKFLSGNPYHHDTPSHLVPENQKTTQHRLQEDVQHHTNHQQVYTQNQPVSNTNSNTPRYATQQSPNQGQPNLSSRQQAINHNVGHAHQPMRSTGDESYHEQQRNRPPQEIVDAYHQSTQFYKNHQPDNQQDTQQNSYQQDNLYSR